MENNIGDRVVAEGDGAVAEVIPSPDPLMSLSNTQLLDMIPDAVSISDRNGRLVYLNDAWRNLIGATQRDSALATDPDAEYPAQARRPDGSPISKDGMAINRALLGETVRESEIILESSEGGMIWLQTNARPIVDASGTVIGAISSSHDVTQLHLLEGEHTRQRDELRQKLQELQLIISSMADGVLITNANGDTRLTNPAYDKMIGSERGWKTASERFHDLRFRNWDGRRLDWADSPVSRALAGEQFTNEELLIVGADGEDLYERVSGGPLLDGSGGVVGGVFLVRDVTHIHEDERRKNEFLSLVAHELRTPITLIRGFTQLLRQSLEGSHDEETDHRLAIIDRRSEQLSRLISELLDVSRLETGTFAIHAVTIDYRDLVVTVGDDMAAMKTGRRVVINGSAEAFVLGDALRLQQVLINLIDNAFTHGPPDTKVTITLRSRDHEVITEVVDEGQAIPMAERERIFERFYQAGDAHSSYRKGIGLGLYITRRIVEAHGGRIWVLDGDACAFAFSLPAQREVGTSFQGSSFKVPGPT